MNQTCLLWCLLTVLLPLAACARTTVLPAWEGDAVTVQFSARAVPQATDLPLQGGLRLGPEGGQLGLILQHGRTLGQCTLTPHDSGVDLSCRPGAGMGGRAEILTRRVALAVYRALLPPPPNGADWSLLETKEDSALRHVVYKDTVGTVDIRFMEVKRP